MVFTRNILNSMQRSAGGSEGNWLMPNIHAFLKKSLWYKNAGLICPRLRTWIIWTRWREHLPRRPALSACGATHRMDWKREAIIKRNSMSFARDDKGRPVDTLFNAWKRRWPNSKTMLITGKEWWWDVRGKERLSVDILVTGPNHPDYLKHAEGKPCRSWYRQWRGLWPESGHLGFFVDLWIQAMSWHGSIQPG